MELNLTKLGYTIKWKELEILVEEELNTQILEFEKGKDTNKEHYRYNTLCNWMDGENSFSTKKLLGIIDILKNDGDKAMATAAYFRLYKMKLLSNEQKAILEAKWTDNNDQLKLLIETEKLKIKIISGNISVDLFEDCIQRRKIGLLRMIIANTDNNLYLGRLLTFEHSKKIRNIAKEKYKRINNNRTNDNNS